MTQSSTGLDDSRVPDAPGVCLGVGLGVVWPVEWPGAVGPGDDDGKMTGSHHGDEPPASGMTSTGATTASPSFDRNDSRGPVTCHSPPLALASAWYRAR